MASYALFGDFLDVDIERRHVAVAIFVLEDDLLNDSVDQIPAQRCWTVANCKEINRK